MINTPVLTAALTATMPTNHDLRQSSSVLFIPWARFNKLLSGEMVRKGSRVQIPTTAPITVGVTGRLDGAFF